MGYKSNIVLCTVADIDMFDALVGGVADVRLKILGAFDQTAQLHIAVIPAVEIGAFFRDQVADLP